MSDLKFLVALVILAAATPALLHAGEAAPPAVIRLAETRLAPLGTDPVIVQAVKEQNAQNKSLEAVKAMDEKWKATPGIADFMQALMDSACGKRLREIQNTADYYAEIFVMDRLGANVAMTDKTSDYWQGDEAKFTESYKSGRGGIHVSEVAFDESAQAYLVQVSVPVKAGDTVIGAITFGIDLDRLE